MPLAGCGGLVPPVTGGAAGASQPTRHWMLRLGRRAPVERAWPRQTGPAPARVPAHRLGHRHRRLPLRLDLRRLQRLQNEQTSNNEHSFFIIRGT
jgi:hypothetical protein